MYHGLDKVPDLTMPEYSWNLQILWQSQLHPHFQYRFQCSCIIIRPTYSYPVVYCAFPMTLIAVAPDIDLNIIIKQKRNICSKLMIWTVHSTHFDHYFQPACQLTLFVIPLSLDWCTAALPGYKYKTAQYHHKVPQATIWFHLETYASWLCRQVDHSSV